MQPRIYRWNIGAHPSIVALIDFYGPKRSEAGQLGIQNFCNLCIGTLLYEACYDVPRALSLVIFC